MKNKLALDKSKKEKRWRFITSWIIPNFIKSVAITVFMLCFILNIYSQMYVTYKYSLNKNLSEVLDFGSLKILMSDYNDNSYYYLSSLIAAQFSSIFLSK